MKHVADESPNTFNYIQETLIDSDEDDALSYILHQQVPQQDLLQDYIVTGTNQNQQQHLNHLNKCLVYKDSFEDHHLSCSRSSHPRHICGIGGTHRDKLSHLNARLREESQRALVFNQKLPLDQSKLTSNDINSIRAHRFTQNLKIIQDHLAKSSKIDRHLSATATSALAQHQLPSTSSDNKSQQIACLNHQEASNRDLVSNETVPDTSEYITQQQQQQQAISVPRQTHNSTSSLVWLVSKLTGRGQSRKQNNIKIQDRSRAITCNSKTNVASHQGRRNNEPLGMYSYSQQLGGQPGAYYATQTSAQGGHSMQLPYAHTQHPHQHQHHYPLSSDSSSGSSVFANSALRMNAFIRGCCSKKCLFISCLMLILLIFISVILLSAYLSFLINVNKPNLAPLSGRLKVDTQGDLFVEQLANRSSKEFLAKQQQYETILRGAFDRTQSPLKSFPNHLVKCEVYSFKQGSLWVYFRLFINKRTFLQDTQLMKRRSQDEHLDRHFLPRLTQQTLHSGFQQLISSQGSRELVVSERASRSSQTVDLKRQRESRTSSQRDHVRSFDDQINRLMPIIEFIDLDSLQVTPEFDMLQTSASSTAQLQSMSDNLRASQLLTTAATPVMIATGSNKNLADHIATTIEIPTTTRPSVWPSIITTTTDNPARTQTGSDSEISVSTKKFVLYGYKENITRPATSSRPAVVLTTTMQSQQQNRTSQDPQTDSLFLINQQRKPAPKVNQTVGKLVGQQRDNSPRQSGNAVKENVSSKLTGGITAAANGQVGILEEMVVKLVSGQPVVSQNNYNGNNNLQKASSTTSVSRAPDDKSTMTSNNRNITLFGPLPKLDQIFVTNITTQQESSTTDTRSGQSNERVVNETASMQMIAPYQKIEFSGRPTIGADGARGSDQTTTASIQDLWNNALSNSKKNVAPAIAPVGNSSTSQPKRLITVTTIGEQDFSNNSLLDWHKISVLSSDISDTIRAQLNASLSHESSQKQKVSPHLKQGGSLISTSLKQDPQSSVVLSKDFLRGNNERLMLSSSNSSQARVQPQHQHHHQPKQVRKPHRDATSESSEPPKQRSPKPAIKKLKSSLDIHKNVSAKDANLTSGKGITIVDTLLATMGSSLSNSTTTDRQINVNHNSSLTKSTNNKTQEAFNFNADQMVPTLPTTIDLTRSTTASPPTRTTNLHQVSAATSEQDRLNNHRAASNVDFTTTPPNNHQRQIQAQLTTTESPFQRSANGTLNRPANQPFNTVQTPRPRLPSLSSQWKPIENNATLDSSGQLKMQSKPPLRTRKPSLSLIVGPQRLPSIPNGLTNQGSQSPFAMAAAILDQQQPRLAGSRINLNDGTSQRINSLLNSLHIASAGNEFESHRVSRMRPSENTLLLNNILGQSFATSTTSSLNLDSNTRIVDDFMITTDKIDGNTRGATLLDPLVISSLGRGEPVSRLRTSDAVEPQPRRTQDPFAFETLKAPNLPTSTISLIDNFPDLIGALTSRTERSPIQIDTSKLLLRKKLFLGDDDPLRAASTNAPTHEILEPIEVPSPELPLEVSSPSEIDNGLTDRFGHRRPAANATRDLPIQFDSAEGENSSRKCPYFGCEAKNSHRFTCLNQSQICDDVFDCQNESDELDCASLLKYDGKTGKLSFSNGGGIIYLNRRGALAPLCVDYFTDESGNYSSSGTRQDAEMSQSGMSKKQQELVQQINTIGQYVCNLQSFSRLVSVKINHHDMVDTANLIKSSKLYHRLSIVDSLDKSHQSFGSYKPTDHQVGVSISPDCPSQQTVFVKCGSFECGLDSFSVIESRDRPRGGTVMNDFPWLVKLYWRESLSCHGYLIDELWLISSSTCFANRSDLGDTEWTAEISYEHYGNEDYQLFESNRRIIRDIMSPPSESGRSRSSIVLAKLDKPVRFSPLNRPICLPLAGSNRSVDSNSDEIYKDCMTAILPSANLKSPTRDMLLKKVKLHNTVDCLTNGSGDAKLTGVICVSEESRGARNRENDETRVLICSTSQTSHSRSKWTVVGVQNNAQGLQLDPSKQLFTVVSSEMSWIVDTMNPNPLSSLHPEGSSPYAEVDKHDLSSDMTHQNEKCDRFKCSSGECVSWSRICDGLYDCSSHEDEKDCHK